MISFDVLINPPTETTIFNAMVAKMVSVGIPANQWNQRGVAIGIIRALANTGGTLASIVSNGIKSRFVGRDANGNLLATGGWLTLAALFDFNVDRVLASSATTSLTLGNNGGNSYAPLAAGTFIAKNSAGKAFKSTADITLNPGNQNVACPVIAVETGTDSNTAPDDTWTIVSPADPNITIVNASAALATDDQDDEDLTDLCTAKIGAASMNGPRGAYAYAISVAVRDDNGLPVNVNRWQKLLNDSSGTIQLYLAAPSGTPDSHDIAGVVNSIEAIARPDTVTVNVAAATALPTAGTLTVWAKTTAGVTAAQIQSAVNAALEAGIASYPIGGIATTSSQGYLYAETIEAWAQASHSAIFKVDYSAPDLALGAGQVAQLNATVNVRFVTVSV